MKRDASWAAAFVVAIATSFSLSSMQSKPISDSLTGVRSLPASGQNPAAKISLDEGPCSEAHALLRNFFALQGGTWLGPKSCDPVNSSHHPPPPTSIPATARFIIATLPDPLHTHLPLVFDQYTEAIQQSATDSGYIYDSSWLPWETEENPYPLIGDADLADDRKRLREAQPGIILFRKSLANHGSDPPKLPYQDCLIVFVVGEEPTAGIHRAQLENAIQWISFMRTRGNFTAQSLQILGPSFSGSFPSLVQTLNQPEVLKDLIQLEQTHLDIFSGAVTSLESVRWFVGATGGAPTPNPQPQAKNPLAHTRGGAPQLSSLGIFFRSFQQSDNVTQDQLCNFLAGSSLDTDKLAIVAEDETAYGFTPTPTPAAAPTSADADPRSADVDPRSADVCKVKGLRRRGTPTFYYPRDISALRAAYQQQSLFTTDKSQPSTDTIRHTLRTDLADPEGKQHDTIRTYGATQTALSQEAVLMQLVDMLRAHRTQFILLKSSNPLDQLFLAHFFKLTYPEGRVIVMGANLLLRRESGANGLDGILVLSNYPLLPDIDHWTKYTPYKQPAPSLLSELLMYFGLQDQPSPSQEQQTDHSHRTFSNGFAEGTYLALRFLLIKPDPGKNSKSRSYFLPDNCSFDAISFRIPDYSKPFWLDPDRNTKAGCHQPITWLSVLGNSGFLPVASLDDKKKTHVFTNDAFFEASLTPETSSRLLNIPWQIITGPFAPNQDDRWPFVPLSMDLAIVATLLWAAFHAVCAWRASITVKPDHRAYFVAQPEASHALLMVLGSVLIVVVASILSWGFGWLTPTPAGQPMRYPGPYNSFPIVVWGIAGFAIIANSWAEHRRAKLNSRSMLEATFPPALLYIFLTFGFCLLLGIALENDAFPESFIPIFIRSMNLTSGVSPVVPIVLLAVGMYGWVWYSLKGLALLGPDRPCLPPCDTLKIEMAERGKMDLLTMLSEKRAGEPLVKLCGPFEQTAVLVAIAVIALLLIFVPLFCGGAPIRSFGLRSYSLMVFVGIVLSIGILIGSTYQVVRLWLRLRSLLTFLDKLPLRRTFQAMRGFTWGSIWKMGGNAFDVRFKIFYRQFETLNHLSASLANMSRMGKLYDTPDAEIKRWYDELGKFRDDRIEFSLWYAQNWDKWKARDLTSLQKVQAKLAEITGYVLTQILIPAWRAETESLIALGEENGSSDLGATDIVRNATPDDAYVRNAEEVVCLLYLGFVQNIVGRIRSLVMAMVWLFLSIALVVPSYPFDPRPLLTGAVMTLFAVVGLAVFVVYSQMFRDATLSHLTNTKPGELGWDFWIKILSFGIGPLFGLLATLFPNFSSTFMSLLQPGLSSIK